MAKARIPAARAVGSAATRDSVDMVDGTGYDMSGMLAEGTGGGKPTPRGAVAC
jgi:hypothetical protein